MKIGYLFSGQGSQFKDMGTDLYAENATYRKVVDEASSVLNQDFSNPDVFDNQKNTQVAILTFSYGIYRILADELPKASAMVGLSLGEYSALVAAKALYFKSALKLVSDRSDFMAEAGKQHPGSMAAVLGISPDKVAEVVADVADAYPANFNTDKQTVIGGTEAGVKDASERLKREGSKRIVPLKVAVASHTPLMTLASQLLSQRLEQEDFSDPAIPVISNTDVDLFTKDNLKDTLTRQLINPTHFKDDLEFMQQQFPVDTLIEIGPGKTLSRFAKKTLPDVSVYNVDSVKTLRSVENQLGVKNNG